MEHQYITTRSSESALRRQASPEGYTIRKRGDGYMIVDTSTGGVVAGVEGPVSYTMTLDDAATWFADTD